MMHLHLQISAFSMAVFMAVISTIKQWKFHHKIGSSYQSRPKLYQTERDSQKHYFRRKNHKPSSTREDDGKIKNWIMRYTMKITTRELRDCENRSIYTLFEHPEINSRRLVYRYLGTHKTCPQGGMNETINDTLPIFECLLIIQV